MIVPNTCIVFNKRRDWMTFLLYVLSLFSLNCTHKSFHSTICSRCSYCSYEESCSHCGVGVVFKVSLLIFDPLPLPLHVVEAQSFKSCWLFIQSNNGLCAVWQLFTGRLTQQVNWKCKKLWKMVHMCVNKLWVFLCFSWHFDRCLSFAWI